jgi:hypothetical protein
LALWFGQAPSQAKGKAEWRWIAERIPIAIKAHLIQLQIINQQTIIPQKSKIPYSLQFPAHQTPTTAIVNTQQYGPQKEDKTSTCEEDGSTTRPSK